MKLLQYKKPMLWCLLALLPFKAALSSDLDRAHLTNQQAIAPPSFQVAFLGLGKSKVTPVSASHHNTLFKDSDYKDPMLSFNKFHKYMGIGAVALGIVTALTAPGDIDTSPSAGDYGIHKSVANIATGMAVLAATSGFLLHFDDLNFNLKNGITDPDNLHMALGLLGTLGYVSAVSSAPQNKDHSSMGLIGGTAMLLAIKLEW